MRRTRGPHHWIIKLTVGLLTTLSISVVIPGCGVGYVVRSAYFQAELLGSRVPVEQVRERNTLKASEVAAFDRIADVKEYGKEIGLKATENYDTYADNWDRTIWNLTACPELDFKPVTWNFPVVGKVPYLGFFRRQDANVWANRLQKDGNEIYLRTAGAYSTLGWFRDPILPGMLKWNDYQLANTVLHELAHATLWIKGSVSFNESFASFVGDKAAFAYLEDRFGSSSIEYQSAAQRHADLHIWRMLLRDLYHELDTVYESSTLTESEKRTKRDELYSSLPNRVATAPFSAPERFAAAASNGEWNNARLMQFRTYNTKTELFEAIYDQEGRDLLRFMARIDQITSGTKAPYKALKQVAELQP